MMGKKKKRRKTSAPEVEEKPSAPDWSSIYDPRVKLPESGGESDKLVFNAECTEFADKLNYDKHNQYITGMFHDMVEEGITDASAITMAMLKDQAPNCPWDDQAKWTELMEGLHGQLLAAVQEYAARF